MPRGAMERGAARTPVTGRRSGRSGPGSSSPLRGAADATSQKGKNQGMVMVASTISSRLSGPPTRTKSLKR